MQTEVMSNQHDDDRKVPWKVILRDAAIGIPLGLIVAALLSALGSGFIL